MHTPTTLGEVAYEAYSKFSHGKSLISGAPLPHWHDQAIQIRQAWEAAADAVVRQKSHDRIKPQPVNE